MSNTKGSMLISNADAVGTELVNQLGGTGYKPSEWSDAINLLGIKSADIPTALAGITPGSYSGSERGSIKYTTGNAVGAMLNKKYNTNRGFKPVEWEDAISKLTPLPENTVSGEICNIQDGAEDVPISSWQVTLPASLSGYSAIGCTQTGKNLAKIAEDTKRSSDNCTYVFENNGITITATGTYARIDFTIPLVKGVTYTFSCKAFSDADYKRIGLRYNEAWTGFIFNQTITGTETEWSYTFTATEDYIYLSFYVTATSTSGTMTVKNIMFEIGSSASSFEAYTAPTTATASLGRTIYGGTADVVNGTGTDEYSVPFTFDGSLDEDWKKHGTIASWFYIDLPFTNAYANNAETGFITSSWGTQKAYANVSSLANGEYAYGVIERFVIKNTDYTEVADFKQWLSQNPITLVYKLATPTDFTFTPITPTPETPLGVSNWWADNGLSEITYHQDLDLITE